LAAAPAQAVVLDLSTVTCKQFIEGDKDQIAMVLTWLDGWYKGDEDEAIIDTDVFVAKTQAPKEERRDYINAEDIETYFPSAGFELPVARMALINAKNAGYLHAMGGGKYRLNPVGHNLVTHKLPGDGGTRPKKRRSAKKRR
jgi:hypothetical protein